MGSDAACLQPSPHLFLLFHTNQQIINWQTKASVMQSDNNKDIQLLKHGTQTISEYVLINQEETLTEISVSDENSSFL